MNSDLELLRAYATAHSEPAFETLVARHVSLIYSAALRQVREPELAQDITQSVFLLLARKAGSLGAKTIVPGWLYRTTRYVAAAALTSQRRRQHREQEAHMQGLMEPAQPDEAWEEVAPLLDESMAHLGGRDRDALLLRYFQNKSLREVGADLGVDEYAAQKRVGRALERLRGFFAKRGVSSTTVLLSGALSAHAVQAVPATVVKSVTLLAVAQGATTSGPTLALMKGALKLMVWSKAQTAAVGLVVVGLATLSILQCGLHSRLRQQNQALRQRVDSLEAENNHLSGLAAPAHSSPAAPAQPADELLRLRGEVGMLRRQTNELRGVLAKANNRPPRPASSPQEPTALPADYPKTVEDATQGIIQALSGGDLEKFFTNFGQPGQPKQLYQATYFDNEEVRKALAGMKVVSVGTPTNSAFGPHLWWVPCRIRLADGSEMDQRLHIGQDPRTQKWFFVGGL